LSLTQAQGQEGQASQENGWESFSAAASFIPPIKQCLHEDINLCFYGFVFGFFQPVKKKMQKKLKSVKTQVLRLPDNLAKGWSSE
jgi:hypothetical protein